MATMSEKELLEKISELLAEITGSRPTSRQTTPERPFDEIDPSRLAAWQDRLKALEREHSKLPWPTSQPIVDQLTQVRRLVVDVEQSGPADELGGPPDLVPATAAPTPSPRPGTGPRVPQTQMGGVRSTSLQPALTAGSAISIRADHTLPMLLIGMVLAAAAAVGIGRADTATKIIIVAGTLALGLALLVFLRPELGAYFLLITVFSNLSDLFTESGLPSINQPLVGLIVISILIHHVLRTGKVTRLPKLGSLEWTLLAYFSVVVASIYVATNRQLSADLIVRFAKDILIMFSIVTVLTTEEKWKRGLWIVMIVVSILSLMGVVRAASGNELLTFGGLAKGSVIGQVSEQGELRYGGPMGLPNVWGQVLVTILPLVLYRVVYEKKGPLRIATAAAGVIIFLAILLTNSRGALLTMLLLLPIIILEMRTRTPGILLIAGIGIIVALFLPSSYSGRLESLAPLLDRRSEYSAFQDEAIRGRASTMLTGLAMFRANPILGVGVGNFGTNYWTYATDIGLESAVGETESMEETRSPHSLYIEILSETGLLGFLSFTAFFGSLLAALLGSRRRNGEEGPRDGAPTWISSLLMSLLAYLISGSFLHGLFLFRYLWVIVALALAGLRIFEKPKGDTLQAHSG